MQFYTVTIVLLSLQGLANNNGVHAQGAITAKVEAPTVQSALGIETKLSCAIPDEAESDKTNTSSSSLRYCVWERIPSLSERSNAFIINFNDINSQPGLFSGMSGYSYHGEGFPSGDCGMKINSVKDDDIAKWQCTLITDDKVYRGYIDLEKFEPVEQPKKENTTSPVASSRTSIDDGADDSENRPRPIITSYNDARAIIQPEIIVQSTASDGTPLIQEVKVESAGLQIKPKRGGKLIVFE